MLRRDKNVIIIIIIRAFVRRTMSASELNLRRRDSSSLVDSTRHIVSQPERTTGTAQSSVPVGRQEEKARLEPVVAVCILY